MIPQVSRLPIVLLAWLTLCLSAGATSLPDAPPAPTAERFTPTDAQRTALERGDVLTDSAREEHIRLQATGVINAPPEVVWSIIRDFDGTDRWAPDMVESRVIRRQGNRMHALSRNRAPWPISDPESEIILSHEETELQGTRVWVQRWSMVPDSGNVSVNDGYWILEAWGDNGTQTLAHQVIWLAPHVPVPAGIVRRHARTRLSANFEALREHALRQARGN